ncbi:DUF423 domain-containing protein [Gammaproteobacteria bacterium]|nr:DUF423 domain-containing protein [Gammaproteobacteria bacterium]
MNSLQVTIFSRRVLSAGAGFALLAVILGAFAAHGLKAILDAQQLALFETASRYQMYHALALLVVGVMLTNPQFSRRLLKYAAVAFILGIILFSGSLYLLALFGVSWLGAITPIGGIAFLAGWLVTMVAALKPVPQIG